MSAVMLTSFVSRLEWCCKFDRRPDVAQNIFQAGPPSMRFSSRDKLAGHRSARSVIDYAQNWHSGTHFDRNGTSRSIAILPVVTKLPSSLLVPSLLGATPFQCLFQSGTHPIKGGLCSDRPHLGNVREAERRGGRRCSVIP